MILKLFFLYFYLLFPSITSNEDIENNIEQLDNEVKENSNFSSWQEMLESATHYYFEKQLKNIFK